MLFLHPLHPFPFPHASSSSSLTFISFSILGIEILTKNAPYAGMKRKNKIPELVVKNVQLFFLLSSSPSQNFRPTIPPCPSALSELIRACWVDLPHSRPTFSAILDALRDLEVSPVRPHFLSLS